MLSTDLQPQIDGYSATLKEISLPCFRSLVLRAHADGVCGEKHRPGLHYGDRLSLLDERGRELAALSWNGRTEGMAGLCLIEAKGPSSSAIVDELRRRYPEHACTRIDSAVDLNYPGAFVDIDESMLHVKRLHRLSGERRGDWESDDPTIGLTRYIGSPKGVAMARGYEKGKQPGFAGLGLPDWVRMEVQVRPQGDARMRYATASAEQVWGATKWADTLYRLISGRQVELLSPYEKRRASSFDAKQLHMVRQYGRTLERLHAELGSWEEVGRYIGGLMPAEELASERGEAKRWLEE